MPIIIIVRVYPIAILSLLLLWGCETPQSTGGHEFVRVGPPGKGHLVRRPTSQSFEDRFSQDVLENGLGPAVNRVVTPSYADSKCHQVSLTFNEVDLGDLSAIDQMIKAGFDADSSCKKVFTGNAGNTTSAGYEYARTMAYSMIQDMCKPEDANIGKILSSPSMGSRDALSLSLFNKGAKSGSSPENLSTTYALMYSLGQRESNGNFKEGRDVSARNTSSLTREAGAFQVSANSLNLKGRTSETKYFLKDIFRSFVTNLKSKSIQDKASLCLLDKISGSWETNNSSRDASTLDGLFKQGDCKTVPDSMSGRNYKVSTQVAACFAKLNKYCPAFAIKYGAGVARINRHHNGPLKTHAELRSMGVKSSKFFKPYLKPACHGVFKTLVTNKDKVCNQSGPDVAIQASTE